MRGLLFALIPILLLLNCAPKPTESIDLKKMRASFQLADGSSISEDDYDDINPILIRLNDERLALLFMSDRPCGTCTDGFYNIFGAISTDQYFAGEYLPSFSDPVPILSLGSAIDVNSYPSNFQASLYQGSLLMIFESGGTIYSGTIPPDLSFTDIGPLMSIPNTNHDTDTLVYVDFRRFSLISVDSAGDAYASMLGTPDPGTYLYNPYLAYTNGATPLTAWVSGYTDAFLYEYGGYLAMGTQNFDLNYMANFNSSLDYEEISLSYVSALRHITPAAEVLVFSAGSEYGYHDLYAVDSHTLEQLVFFDGDIGFQYYYDDYFNIYPTSGSPDGNLGGVAGADAICNSDPLQPDINVYYKAMIVDSAGTRRASMSGPTVGDGQIDWVLSPFTTYVQAMTGAPLGTTDNVGLLTSMSAPILPVPPVSAWTGFTGNNDWQTDLTNNCSSWGSTAGNGAVGAADDYITGSFVGDASPVACTTPGNILYCVEQP